MSNVWNLTSEKLRSSNVLRNGMSAIRPLARSWLAACLLLGGCATAAQRQMQATQSALPLIYETANRCAQPIWDNPKYAPIAGHLSDRQTGMFSAAQMVDRQHPTILESKLVLERLADVALCQRAFLLELSTIRPDLVPAFMDFYNKAQTRQADVVMGKLTWGESARLSNEQAIVFKADISALDQQWIADLNTAHQNEIAQRQAASSALAQWAHQQQQLQQQQQMINNMNRPLTTNCVRTGAYTNCTTN